MIVKVHKGADGKKVIAVCDTDIAGRRFEEGELQLDLGSPFYNGEEMAEEKLENELKGPCSVNITGEESVKFFTDRKLVDEKNIIRIKGIPHAQCMLMKED
ncbi:MAG: DUF424 family protein [Candidatus Woesearchaeota archaeon]